MQKYLTSILVLLTFLTGFFCTNSPFDTKTNLGTDILDDFDPLLTTFDAKLLNDTITADSSGCYSFLDTIFPDTLIKDSALMKGSIISGVQSFSELALGSWQNEDALVFLKFRSDSLLAWIDSISNNPEKKLLSIAFTFKNLSQYSSKDLNTYLEIGYSNAAKTGKNITTLTPVKHYGYNSTVNLTHVVPFTNDIISQNDSIVRDTTSHKFTSRFLHRIEKSKKGLDTITAKTVTYPISDSIGPFTNDTIVLDKDTVGTMVSYVLGVIRYVRDTITCIRDTSVYDSLALVSELVKTGQVIAKSSSHQLTSGDTVFFIDSIITVTDTNASFKINTSITHVITNGDTIDVISYDTVYSLKEISRDTIIQNAISAQRNTIITKINSLDSLLYLYARLDPLNDKSLQYISSPKLRVTYSVKDSLATDTLSMDLAPSYYDFSVKESNPALYDTSAVSSGAAGRYAVMKVDLSPLWNSMKDSTGTIRYRNIPKADITVPVDTVLLPQPDSSVKSVSVYYYLSNAAYGSLEEIRTLDSLNKIVPPRSLNTASKSVTLSINRYLIDLLYSNPGADLNTLYLHLWIKRPVFGQIHWKNAPEVKIPINFIVSDFQ